MLECFNKECSGNKENQCIVTDRVCISRATEPINYEEEYYKLKKVIEITKEKGKEWINKYEQLKEENKRLKEEAEKDKKEVCNENLKLTSEIIKLKEEIEELQETANSFEIVADKYRIKQETMESDLIKYESVIKNQKEAIKALAKLL